MPDVDIQDITFLTKQELAVRWRVKTRTIENWVRENKIPKPFKMSNRKALWKLEDVVAHELEVQEACKK